MGFSYDPKQKNTILNNASVNTKQRYGYGDDTFVNVTPGSSTSTQTSTQPTAPGYSTPPMPQAPTPQAPVTPQAPTPSQTPPQTQSQGQNTPGLYDFITQGAKNLGIGGQPVTFQQAVETWNANLPQNARPTAVTAPTVQVPQIGGAPQVQAGQVSAPPTIQAPQVTSAQVDLGDANEFQKALFESTYRPIDRELQNQLQLQNRNAQSSLANNGLSGSGVEQAVLGQIRDENSRQRAAALYDSANQATVARFGYEFQTKLFNAQQEQAVRLANAGFDMQAQVSNATNILQASMANAQMATQASIANAQNATQTNIAQANLAGQIGLQNAQLQMNAQLANNQYAMQQQQTYYNLLGLSLEQGRSAVDDFLEFTRMGLQDQQFLDQLDMQVWGTMLNTYLGQIGQIVNAGTGAGSKGSGSSSGFDLGLRGSGGGGQVGIPSGA